MSMWAQPEAGVASVLTMAHVCLPKVLLQRYNWGSTGTGRIHILSKPSACSAQTFHTYCYCSYLQIHLI